jgi:glycosyltransferase involved in cell wall biosynthesis
MRVGIYLNDLSPQEGGAHTFEAEILQALLRSAVHSRHTFILFSHQLDQPQHLPASASIQWVYLERPEWLERAQKKSLYWLNQITNKLPGTQTKRRERNALDLLWRKAIEQYKIDMTWSFGPYTVFNDIPHIVTIWDLQHRLQSYFPEVSNGGQWQGREVMYQQLIQRASYIFVGTQVGKAEIERFYQVPAGRVKVIPFPTPSFVMDVSFEQDLTIFDRYQLPAQYLFYPAQFWPHKNHANLLLAIQHLKEQCNLTVPVVFVGSNKGNQAYIQRLTSELGLVEQVKFLGFIPQQDLVSLYQNAQALAFVSFFGPDNLPPLEAFALGCPVIAAKVSGAEEQLQDAAILVDPTDPLHIAAAIQQLWLDPAIRHDRIERGLARSRSWTGQDYVDQAYAILDDFQAMRRCWDAGVIYE